MKIREIMTAKPSCIAPQNRIKDAATRMKNLDIGALPVCANDRLVGMLTDRDIVVRAVALGRDPGITTVRDAMSPGIVCCFEDDEVEVAAKKMESSQIRRLAVLNRAKRLVGIVSLGDIATGARKDRLGGEVLERISESSHARA